MTPVEHAELLADEIVKSLDKLDPRKLLKQAYLAGGRQCLYEYAVHKDGKLVVGCGAQSFKEAFDQWYDPPSAKDEDE